MVRREGGRHGEHHTNKSVKYTNPRFGNAEGDKAEVPSKARRQEIRKFAATEGGEYGSDTWELCGKSHGGCGSSQSATLGDFIPLEPVCERPVWVMNRDVETAPVKHGWVLA